MRTIALNEWPLSGAWIVSPNVRVWAITPCRTASGQTHKRTLTPLPSLPNFGRWFILRITDFETRLSARECRDGKGNRMVRYWEGRCVSGRRLTLPPFSKRIHLGKALVIWTALPGQGKSGRELRDLRLV